MFPGKIKPLQIGIELNFQNDKYNWLEKKKTKTKTN